MSSFENDSTASAASTLDLWRSLCEAADDDGLLSFRQYMDIALYGPGGYYQRQVRLGRAGADFYTAAQFPLFGLTLGRYIYQLWQRSERRAMPSIVEFGPGQGELAYWVCTYLLSVLGEQDTGAGRLEYSLVERSDYLRQVQKQRLAPLSERIDFNWLEPYDVGRLNGEAEHAFVIANELLDALPVERVRRAKDGFEQGFVHVAGAARPDAPLKEVFLPADERLRELAQKYTPVPQSHSAEVCRDYDEVFRACASLAREIDGVLFDYGIFAHEWKAGIRPQGTLRAFRKHTLANVLHQPGEADITADVNWDLARDAASCAGVLVEDILTQGSFLMRNGIMDVAMELTQQNGSTPLSRELGHGESKAGLSTTSALKQLVLPGGMGERFSAFVFTKRGGSGEQRC